MITVCEQCMSPEYCGNFRDVQYAVIFGHCIQVSVKHLLFQTRTLMWQNPHQMRDHTTLLPVEERPVSNTWWTVHCKQLVFVQEFPQHWYKECTTICSGNHLNRDTSQSSNNLRSETAHTVIMHTPLRKSECLCCLAFVLTCTWEVIIPTTTRAHYFLHVYDFVYLLSESHPFDRTTVFGVCFCCFLAFLMKVPQELGVHHTSVKDTAGFLVSWSCFGDMPLVTWFALVWLFNFAMTDVHNNQQAPDKQMSYATVYYPLKRWHLHSCLPLFLHNTLQYLACVCTPQVNTCSKSNT